VLRKVVVHREARAFSDSRRGSASPAAHSRRSPFAALVSFSKEPKELQPSAIAAHIAPLVTLLHEHREPCPAADRFQCLCLKEGPCRKNQILRVSGSGQRIQRICSSVPLVGRIAHQDRAQQVLPVAGDLSFL